MKSTGMVRKVDDLGRVCLPIELRNTLDLKEKDPVEIFTDGDQIILKKYAPGCVLCGNMENLLQRNDKHVCQECVDALIPKKAKKIASA